MDQVNWKFFPLRAPWKCCPCRALPFLVLTVSVIKSKTIFLKEGMNSIDLHIHRSTIHRTTDLLIRWSTQIHWCTDLLNTPITDLVIHWSTDSQIYRSIHQYRGLSIRGYPVDLQTYSVLTLHLWLQVVRFSQRGCTPSFTHAFACLKISLNSKLLNKP